MTMTDYYAKMLQTHPPTWIQSHSLPFSMNGLTKVLKTTAKKVYINLACVSMWSLVVVHEVERLCTNVNFHICLISEGRHSDRRMVLKQTSNCDDLRAPPTYLGQCVLHGGSYKPPHIYVLCRLALRLGPHGFKWEQKIKSTET